LSSPILTASHLDVNVEPDKETLLNSNRAIFSLNPKVTNAMDMVTEDLLIEFMQELLRYGPRFTGTYGIEQAAKYCYNSFEESGLDARYQHWGSFNDRKAFRYFKDKNVIGRFEGNGAEEDIIVFNAHLDTVRVSPGANDDGSGVVAVLAAAYIISNFDFNRTIEFVLFSGEEVGLLGSRAYVEEIYANDVELLVEFNADMIGYAETESGGRNVSISCTEDAKWILDEIKNVNQESGLNLNIRTGWSMEPYGQRGGSDFYDFVQYGYESIAFWEAEWNSDYFHKPEDSFEHVNFSYLTNMTKLIVGSIAHMADVKNDNPQIKIGAPSRGMFYFEDRKMGKLKHESTIVIDDFLICTDVKEGDAPIEKVEFYYDDNLMFTDDEIPFQWRINEFSIRKHMIKVVLYDEKGRTSSDVLRFLFINLRTNK